MKITLTSVTDAGRKEATGVRSRCAAPMALVAMTIAWTLALPGCGGEPGREDPGEAFGRLEEAWLLPNEIGVRFHITSEGAFQAELRGELHLGVDGVASLLGEGTFGGEAAAPFLTVSEGRMAGGNRERTFQVAAPAHLREALVMGLTRMGLLHNLARLVAGSPPDRADGTVGEWVQVHDLALEAPREDAPGSTGIRFGISVAGQPAGEATLWLGENGQPVLREQIVRFPAGEMRVVERYEIF